MASECAGLRGGFIVAATGSGAGKTTTSLALVAALRARGLSIQTAKAGPDFLDAAWLAAVSGRPCPNLDGWMGRNPSVLADILSRFAAPADFVIVEGAMGLYDGDANGEFSTAVLAEYLKLPVLLLLNAKGVGQSVAAMAAGFLSWHSQIFSCALSFCGIICTHVGSQRHADILARGLEPVCKKFAVPLLGFLPKKDAPIIPSRHLGLVQAAEVAFDSYRASEWVSAHIDIDLLLKRISTKGLANIPAISAPLPARDTTVIAIARDRAFSFCYADLPLLLEELGVAVRFFSPLSDSVPPPCSAIYFPGGYPELYARQLSLNRSMLEAVRVLARSGLPIYGECGGYMYLLEGIAGPDDAQPWAMTGLLPGVATLRSRFAALGYRAARSAWLGSEAVYGHEFHYAAVRGECAGPIWRLADATGADLGWAGQRKGNVAGSWVHLYPEGSRSFWLAWLDLARSFAGMGKSVF